MFEKSLIEKTAPGADCIEPMKVWKIPEGKEYMFSKLVESGDYFAQIKKDGYWYQFEKTLEGKCYLFSRTTSKTTGILTEKIDNVPHILSALESIPNGTTLIGEIYYPGKTSKEVTTIMGCLAQKAIERQKEKGLIHYYIHDIIKYKGDSLIETPAIDRYNILVELWNECSLNDFSFLELAENYTENLQEKVAEVLAQGEEGMVFKKKECPYSPGKRPAWHNFKIKKVDYLDAICIGFCDATIDYTGKEIENWIYWMNPETNEKVLGLSDSIDPQYSKPITKGCYYGWKTAIEIGAYNDKGEIEEIGTVASGLTDELREAFSSNPEEYLNKVVQIQCMELDKKEHTCRHAFFKGFRDDKDIKDCTIKDIFS